MSATKNLEKAVELLKAEEGAEVDDLEEYLAKVNEVAEMCRAIKAEHKKAVAVIASKKSRARRQERVAKALALLEAQEKAEGDDE